MSRLQKKCFILSMGLHGLLFGVFIFGSAFFVSHQPPQTAPVLTMVSIPDLTDAPTTGGNPNVKAVALPKMPTSTATQPKPADVKAEPPKARVEPTPKPPIARLNPPKDHPHPLDPPKNDSEPVKSKGPKLDSSALTLSTRRTTTPKNPPKAKPTNETDDTSEADARAEAKARQQAIGNAVKSLGKELSSSTVVELPGPGGGGELRANYGSFVRSTYDAAWSNASIGTDDPNATVIARVTIASDGRVIASRILKKSGIPEMDRSVEKALENVTFVGPFPAGSGSAERMFDIPFTLKSKQ